MKQIYIGIITCLLNLSFLNAQTTFNWDTAAIDNGDNVTETIDCITATFTGPTTETTIENVAGFGGSSGNIVLISSAQSSSTAVTFSFSEAVDITSILAIEGNSANIDYTFTPTGGTNSSITASLTSGFASVTLNWSDVTSFIVSSTGAWYGFDNLVISNSTTGTDSRAECNSYTWIDGVNYTTSNNTATFNIVGGAANGCDSLVTLDLTINNSTTGTDIQVACDSYIWPLNSTTYTTTTNTPTFNIVNGAANGCDSLVTLDLTINNSTTGTDIQVACDSYTWIDGITYTASNNSATFIETNAAGCDSIVTLDLTINSLSDLTTTITGTTITSNNAVATYQWLDCDNGNAIIAGETSQSFLATTNGNYAVELTENGCVDTTTCVVITTVGISDNLITEQVSIYPNPNQGIVNIDLGTLKNATVKVFNTTGQLIYKKENISSSKHQFELNEIAGIYFLEVHSNSEQQQYKLIIK